MPLILHDDEFFSTIAGFIQDVRDKSADGLTIAEAAGLLNEFLSKSIHLADILGNPGNDKKTLVLQALGTAFDYVWPAIPLPMLLSPFRVFLTPAARTIVLAIGSGMIDAMVARMRARQALPAA